MKKRGGEERTRERRRRQRREDKKKERKKHNQPTNNLNINIQADVVLTENNNNKRTFPAFLELSFCVLNKQNI